MESEALVQKMDILGNLPPELVQEICKFINHKWIDNALVCSKRWNYVIDYDYYWLKQCKIKGFKKIEKNATSVFYEKYVNKFSSPWKGVYNYNSITENWKNNNFISTVVNVTAFFKIHHFDDEILIATSNYNELIVINSVTGWQLFYYVAIYGVIHYVVRFKDWVIFMEEDYLCCQKFEEEGLLYYIQLNISSSWDMVTSIETHENFVAVVDKHTGLFVFRNPILEHLIIAYTNKNARSICFADSIIVMGTNNGTIEIINFEFENLVTLEYHQENVTIWKTMVQDDYLISFHGGSGCERDYIVSVWSLANQICLYSLKENVNVIPGVTFLNQALLLCLEKKFNEDTHKIIFLDLNSGKHQFEIDSEEFNVKTLTTNGHHVFTVSHLITKVWCMRTKTLVMVIDNVHPYFFKTFKVTGTKVAHIKINGDLELRDYRVNF